MTRHPIPDDTLKRHIAILGSTGSGKTTAAKSGIVEPILTSIGRVLIIDPTAAWWGLRLAADGKGTGFTVYIFGGNQGNYQPRPITLATKPYRFDEGRDDDT